MRARLLSIAVALSLSARAQAPREPPQQKPPPKTMIIKAARLIDGRSDKPRHGQAVSSPG
ncbi:MAG: hypothetical protein E6J64_12715 [Deltaproteobacteria bacterium]|nr:MAG: hypothetical protein E6J64_12715 [Deltaproteobacteria bacterium]